MQYVGAYLIRGGAGALAALVEKLELEEVVQRNSPDVFAKEYRSFGVEEAADVRARARTRPVAQEQRVFILFVPAITVEAQNALLKTLEEPGSAVFFLVSPSPEMLLPTVRSRAQVLTLPETHAAASPVDAQAFLAAPPQKRLEMLKPLYDHEDEGRDIGGVIAFLAALEHCFAAAKRTPENHEGVRAIYRARKYATDRGSLLKTLLEHVALVAPKM